MNYALNVDLPLLQLSDINNSTPPPPSYSSDIMAFSSPPLVDPFNIRSTQKEERSTRNCVYSFVSLSCVPFTKLVSLFSDESNLKLHPRQHSQEAWEPVLLGFAQA